MKDKATSLNTQKV